MFVCWNFCPYWALFLCYHNRSFDKVEIAGNNSPRIGHMEENPHISDLSNVYTSTTRFRPDEEGHGKEMLLTVAYVKNEPGTPYVPDYNTASPKGNESLHGQNLISMNAIKTEQKQK